MASVAAETASETYRGWQEVDAVKHFFLAALDRLPGRQLRTNLWQILWRYIKTSHQDDPFRTVLELLLVFFVIRTILQSRTRSETSGGNFVKLTEKEIDELVREWKPEALLPPIPAAELALTPPPTIIGAPSLHAKVVVTPAATYPMTALNKEEQKEKSVVNLASANFAGLFNNEQIKEKAIECMRGYGVGSCGPPGFYGTFDVHLELERAIARYLRVPACIIYAQAFSTSSSVIPSFSKRGDIIVADRGVNFSIQKGIQISRSTVRWYDHNNLDSLEAVLEGLARDDRKYRRPLTRRFIVTEALFENDGALLDLPRVMELKRKYKYRLMLDESASFGVLGRTGRGITEIYDVPATGVDILLGSLANGLCAAGGFCAGSADVVQHQRINSAAVVFSAALPPLLAVAATEAINYLGHPAANGAYPLDPLPEHIRAVRSVLEKSDAVELLSHPISPAIHLALSRSRAASLSREDQERLLQDVVDEALANGVLLTRAKRVWEQELAATMKEGANEARPTIRICVSAALSRKELEKAANVVRSACSKMLSKKRS